MTEPEFSRWMLSENTRLVFVSDWRTAFVLNDIDPSSPRAGWGEVRTIDFLDDSVPLSEADARRIFADGLARFGEPPTMVNR